MTTLLEVEKPIVGRASTYDIQKVRADFPILQEMVNGKPLVYLDNANTTQKPQIVIDTLREYYETYNSNVHRASHALGAKADRAFEMARHTVQHFLNAELFE